MRAFKYRMLQSHGWLGAGLLAAASLSWLPCQAIAQQPGATTAPAPGSEKSTETKADITLVIGETIQLTYDGGNVVGLIEEVIPVRPNIITIEPIIGNPKSILIKGKDVGITPVTIKARDANNNPLPLLTKVIAVNPDLTYIQSKIKATFPLANVTVTPGGSKGAYIVTGYVENTEDVLALETFINDMVVVDKTLSGIQKPMVTYNIRVVGVHMVQLDVCIAQVDRNKVRRLGFSFLQNDSKSFVGSALGGGFNGSLTHTAPGGLGSLATTGLLNSASGANQVVFGISDASSAFTGLINALKTERAGKLLANPSTVAMSGRPAAFTVGGEEPYGTAGSGGGQGSGVQFRQVGTVVSFLPTVIADGRIRLTVSAANSNVVSRIDTGSIIAPVLATQSIGTTVELENGQSMVVGGLIQNKTTGTTSKLPFLGELPFVGTAFRSVNFDDAETELVILVRPTLVAGLDANQRCNVKLPGTETRGPTDFELYLEGILEAPRGPRDPFPCRQYVPAFKHEPAFGARSGECNGQSNKGCSTGNCGTGNCGNSHHHMHAQQPMQMQMTPGQPIMATEVQMSPTTQVNVNVPSINAPQAPLSETVPVVKVPEALPTELPIIQKTGDAAPAAPALVPAGEQPTGVQPAPETPKVPVIPPANPNG